ISANGKATYSVLAGNATILESSKLGLLREDADFSKSLSLESASAVYVVSDQYELLTSKRKLNAYKANKQVYRLKNSSGQLMDVIFQVSNDGLAVRYYFPEYSSDVKRISNEITSFN